jgi:small acid-soluble spore protein K
LRRDKERVTGRAGSETEERHVVVIYREETGLIRHVRFWREVGTLLVEVSHHQGGRSMRNKDNHPGNFGGQKGIENPKAKTDYAPLRPDGTTAPRPQERMREGAKQHRFPNE